MKYAKIFDSIWDGSMRGKSDPLFVFVNLLTHADDQGVVDRHWKPICDETGLPEKRVIDALNFLEQPDPDSRSILEDGRRIIRIDSHRSWGWRIVNHGHYRELCTRAQNAERQARFRKSNGEVTHSNKVPVAVAVSVDDPESSLSEGDSKGDYPEDFLAFWLAYPRKSGKKAAYRSWAKAKDKPPLPAILEAIRKQSDSEQWQKDSGQFIPMPATWLNQGRWDDVPQEKSTTQNGATADYNNPNDALLGRKAGQA